MQFCESRKQTERATRGRPVLHHLVRYITYVLCVFRGKSSVIEIRQLRIQQLLVDFVVSSSRLALVGKGGVIIVQKVLLTAATTETSGIIT